MENVLRFFHKGIYTHFERFLEYCLFPFIVFSLTYEFVVGQRKKIVHLQMKSLLIFLIFILCLASINFGSNVLERYGDFKDSELCIVIPTRNEAENLPVLVERILPYGYSIIEYG